MLRLLSIIRTLLKYDVGRLLDRRQNARLSRLLRSKLLLLLLYPQGLLSGKYRQIRPARALVLCMQELGPVYIKFGQILSTRRDLLDDELAQELANLQDNLPPIDDQLARSTIEQALGQSIEQLFADFSANSLAAASVAQVHRARLLSGEQVVVKLVRPGIAKQIARDINLMYSLARLLELLAPTLSQRIRPRELVDEYEFTISSELDMRVEAANCASFAHKFAGSDLLKVPKIYWPLVSKDVLVQEYFADKVKVNDLETLKARGVNMQKLAEIGVKIFFIQVFRDGFFHADMHPGNILVDTSNPQQPVYAGVDFGIVGVLSERDLHYLGLNMLAFFERDYQAIARLHIESGWMQGDIRIEHFEQAIRAACEPLQALPLAQLSFAQLVDNLFAVARRFRLIVQPQLLLFQKTLINIEGLGRQIYPELDLWSTVLPELQSWRRRRLDPRRVARKLRRDINNYWPYLQDLPANLQAYQQRQEHNQQLLDDSAEKLRVHMRSNRRWRWLTTVLLALLLVLALMR